MRKLSDYFHNQNHEFFKYNLTSSQQGAAVFASLWAQIDSVLYWNYRNMLVATDEPFEAQQSSDFVAFVSNWYDLRISDFNKVYNASVAVYEPLDNYGMTEETATARKRGEIKNSTDADVKPRVGVQYTTTNDNQSTGRMTSYNVSGIQDSGATVKAAGMENATTKSNYENTETLTTNNLTATGHEVETVTHKRAGNIGVESSQQLLDQEYEIRKKSFIDMFIKSFCAECLTGLYACDDGWRY